LITKEQLSDVFVKQIERESGQQKFIEYAIKKVLSGNWRKKHNFRMQLA